MADKPDQEKTEQPTGKKLEEARQDGKVANSREITSVLILVTGLGIILLSGSWMFHSLSGFMGGIFQNAGTLDLESESLQKFVSVVFGEIFKVLMPIMMSIIVAGLVGNILQTGFMLNSKPFIPKISKINPAKGFKRIFSLKSFVEVIKDVAKLLLISGIAYLIVKKDLYSFPALVQLSISEIFTFTSSLMFKISAAICLALIFLAIVDVAYQRWQYKKDLMMTKQEVKDERKKSEGDPKVKGRIRQLQLETARRRMMEQVPKADVVITNPTHLAIALKYDSENMSAPSVIAKGAGFIAERIKKIAQENGIPVIEHKSLARAIFKVVEIGDLIPVNLYRAVAEVLAYVYSLKQKGNNS